MKTAGVSKRHTIQLNMLDKDTGEVIKVFESLREAQGYLDKKSSGPISNVLAGRAKSAYGYFWIKL